MRAVQIKSFGGPEVLEISENVSIPRPSENQLLVEIHSASINPFDIFVMSSGSGKEPPIILGGDFAGVVKEISSAVTNFKPGDEIYGQALVHNGGSGAFAQFAASNALNTTSKPNNINFDEAASLPLVGTSAVQALIDEMNLSKGQRILIHGGAGGIGSIAIQLAKAIGAYVITTVSSDDIEFAKNLEADEVIDYKTNNFDEVVKDLDAVYDTVGGDITDKSYAVIKNGGVLVSMKRISNPELAKQHGVIAIPQFTKVTSERLNVLKKFVEEGKIKPKVDKIFTIDQIREAFEYMQNASPRGKVVIKIK